MENTSFVRFEIRLAIVLEADTALRELVHRFVHTVYWEVENGEARRNMLGLGINEDYIASRKVQVQQYKRFGNSNPMVRL